MIALRAPSQFSRAPIAYTGAVPGTPTLPHAEPRTAGPSQLSCPSPRTPRTVKIPAQRCSPHSATVACLTSSPRLCRTQLVRTVLSSVFLFCCHKNKTKNFKTKTSPPPRATPRSAHHQGASVCSTFDPISLSPKKKGDLLPKFFWKPFNASHQGASVCSTFDPEMKVTTPNRALGEVN